MRNWLAAWSVGAMVAGGGVASAQVLTGTPPSLTVTVNVRVTDQAHVPPRELADAEARATAAYRAAGFDLVWSPASQEPEANKAAVDVRVVILPRELTSRYCRAEGLNDRVMGFAVSAATNTHGRIAYIFYDRIFQNATTNRTLVERGLGHVLAHEVGHLLLGFNKHSAQGLMQPNWNPGESLVQTFTTSQVQTIRRRFTALTAN